MDKYYTVASDVGNDSIDALEIIEITPYNDCCPYMSFAKTKEQALQWFIVYQQDELNELKRKFDIEFEKLSWGVSQLEQIKEDKND